MGIDRFLKLLLQMKQIPQIDMLQFDSKLEYLCTQVIAIYILLPTACL